MKAGGNAWECVKNAVLSSTARSLIYGGHFFWSAGLQKFASLLSCPLSLLSKASASCWGWSHGAFRQPTLFFDSCLGRGPGKEAVELGIGRLGPPGCFGFYFFDDPRQKPLSLGLSFFLDYIFWVFQKGLLISPTPPYCTGNECIVSASLPFCCCYQWMYISPASLRPFGAWVPSSLFLSP